MKSILVVDDEDALREALRDDLKKAGYTVELAADGDEAIARIPPSMFDLVLLDIWMPKVNGIDVLKHISKHSPDSKVIMITAQADLKHALLAKEFGAIDYITKPFNLDEVTSKVRRALGDE